MIQKHVSDATDAASFVDVWEQLRACGATSWEIDVPDNAGMRMSVLRIVEMPMSVHLSLTTKPSVRDNPTNSDTPSVDVTLWTNEYSTSHPAVVQQPAAPLPGKRIAVQMKMPPWCDRGERSLIGDIVTSVLQMYK